MADIPLVSQIMMSDFKQIDGITRVSEALAMMKKEGVHSFLIRPRNPSDVHGIMTLRDIARKVIAQRRHLHETHVYEIMSKPVLSVLANMPVPYAARILTNFKVSYAMVLSDDKVVGLVSLNGMVTQWEGL